MKSSWRQTFTQLVHVFLDVLAKKYKLKWKAMEILLKINQGSVTKLPGCPLNRHPRGRLALQAAHCPTKEPWQMPLNSRQIEVAG